MIQKRSCSVSTKVNRPFYDVVKICVIVMKNVDILTIHETFENVITILLITYQSKTKISGKIRKCLVYL